MNEKIETHGKSVDDAVNEALLRLGARRDEVDVTIIEEPKSGFLGLVGGRPAKVEVTRKRGRRRGQRRDNNTSQAHEFGDNSRSRQGNGRKKQNSSRNQNRNQNQNQNQNQNRNQNQQNNKDQRNAANSSSNNEQNANQRNRSENQNNKPQKRNQPQKAQKQTRGRNNTKAASARVPQNQPTQGDAVQNKRPRNQRRGRDQALDHSPQSEENLHMRVQQQSPQEQQEAQDRAVRQGDSNQRGRGSRNKPRNERPQRQQVQRQTRNDQNFDSGNHQPGGNRSATSQPNRSQPNRNESNGRNQRSNETRRGPAPKPSYDTAPDEIISTGIEAGKYAQPATGITEENLNDRLVEMTSGLLARSGFSARCSVSDGEYRQIKVNTDDESAGMLIGRHGATIDSVEHLVERMISNAMDDRVRMNLDINNYRSRRHETLLERVEDAVNKVRESGKTYHVEPMNARERRIVHLAVEEFSGMRTFTMDSHRGRHVVIALEREDAEKASDSEPEVTDNNQAASEEFSAPEETSAVESNSDHDERPEA